MKFVQYLVDAVHTSVQLGAEGLNSIAQQPFGVRVGIRIDGLPSDPFQMPRRCDLEFALFVCLKAAQQGPPIAAPYTVVVARGLWFVVVQNLPHGVDRVTRDCKRCRGIGTQGRIQGKIACRQDNVQASATT